METSASPRIHIYQERGFWERISIVFTFFARNWRPLLRYSSYIMVPAAVLGGLCLNLFVESNGRLEPNITPGGMVPYSLFLIFSICAAIMIPAMVYALVKLYATTPQRLQTVDSALLKSTFAKCLKRTFILFFTLLGIYLLVYVLTLPSVLISHWLVVVPVVAFIAIMVPLILTPAFYLLEPAGIATALKKSFRMGFKYWWSTLGVYLVVNLLVLAVVYLFYALWLTLLIGGSLIHTTGGPGTAVLKSLFCLYTMVMLYVFFLACMVQPLAAVAQYGHVVAAYNQKYGDDGTELLQEYNENKMEDEAEEIIEITEEDNHETEDNPENKE